MNDWIHNVDSSTVLWGQTIIYTAYCLVIISLVAWFASKLTGKQSRITISPRVFYTWVGFLTVLGVSLHIITYNTIPWVKDDLHGNPNVAETYEITIADHAWQVPGGKLEVPCDQLVKFSVTTQDLTYGFGIFRQDNSMIAQCRSCPATPTTCCGPSPGTAPSTSVPPSTPARPATASSPTTPWWSAAAPRRAER